MNKIKFTLSKKNKVSQSDRNCMLLLLFAYYMLILCLIPFFYYRHDLPVLVFSLFYLLFAFLLYFFTDNTNLRNLAIFNVFIFNLLISPIILFLFSFNVLILIPFISISIPLNILLRRVKFEMWAGYLNILLKFILTIIYLIISKVSYTINIYLFVYEMFLVLVYFFFIIGFLRNSQYSIKKVSSNLLKIVNRDELTELYNRRYLNENTFDLNQTCCIALVDIDYFKKINDVYGHMIGDFILREVASVFRKYKSDGITIARYGGDEFLFFFEGKKVKSVKIIMNLIRYDVEHLDFGSDIVNEKITISCGVARYSKTLSSLENFKKVDKALYEAKEEGRNRVSVIY